MVVLVLFGPVVVEVVQVLSEVQAQAHMALRLAEMAVLDCPHLLPEHLRITPAVVVLVHIVAQQQQ
jgi:hypothetical protein